MLTAQHRFLDVRLLEAIDGIPAGTVGVLVDFFPTYTLKTSPGLVIEPLLVFLHITE